MLFMKFQSNYGPRYLEMASRSSFRRCQQWVHSNSESHDPWLKFRLLLFLCHYLTFLLLSTCMGNTCTGQRAMKYVIFFFNIRITVCRPHLSGLSVVSAPSLTHGAHKGHHELTWDSRRRRISSPIGMFFYDDERPRHHLNTSFFYN